MNREFFNSLACGVHASVIAAVLLVIPLSFQSCNDDDAALEVPQYELHRGTLSDISWSKSYTPREFEDAFSTAIGGMDLNLLKSIGMDMGPMFGKIADGLLENQGDVLQELFDEEQGRKNAKWEMQAYSITFNSVGYKGEPIELSAIVAFPNAVNGTQFHVLDNISVYNHARVDKNDRVPSKVGDIMLLRAFYNQLVVIPDEEGSGASIDHYFAETENDRNAQQTIDAIKAALELIGGMGIEMKEGYGTWNFGISLGGETCVGFHHYMELNATPEERRLVNLKATFGGAGVITPSMYFDLFDKGETVASLDMGLALNQLEGLLELPALAFGGYDPKTQLFSPELFERKSQKFPGVTLMESRRQMLGREFPQDAFQKIFQNDMLDSNGRFNHDSPKTQALFSYFKKCDLGCGWTPSVKFTLVWSDEDQMMLPYMHQQAYNNLRKLPGGGTNPLMKKHEVDLSFLGQLLASMSHHVLCAYYFLECVGNENPEDLGTY